MPLLNKKWFCGNLSYLIDLLDSLLLDLLELPLLVTTQGDMVSSVSGGEMCLQLSLHLLIISNIV